MKNVFFDGIVVGGGPVGLALGSGLLRIDAPGGGGRKWTVLVVEKDRHPAPEEAWAKSYIYSIDGRGCRILDRIGASRALEGSDPAFRKGERPDVFQVWSTDGSVRKTSIPPSRKRGYRLQRSQLLGVLREQFRRSAGKGAGPSAILQGTVDDVEFRNGEAIVTVVLPDGRRETVRSRFVFGCDGANSITRAILACKDRQFKTKTARSPSGGLVMRNLMIENPDDLGVAFDDSVSIRGRTIHSLSLLKFLAPDATKRRPMSTARRPDFFLYRCRTVDEVYDGLDDEFPQIEARRRVREADVREYLTSRSIVFPQPTWAKKAARCIDGVGVAILGDALHIFPPDIGQGLNAGLLDADRLVTAFDECQERLCSGDKIDAVGGDGDGSGEIDSGALISEALSQYSRESVREARAMCRLIRVMLPHQYNLHGRFDRINKAIFTANGRFRSTIYRTVQKGFEATNTTNKFFYPTAVDLVQRDPPIPYSEILWKHQWNSLMLGSFLLLLVLRIVKTFSR